jgi:hypothetical protein
VWRNLAADAAAAKADEKRIAAVVIVFGLTSLVAEPILVGED